MGTVTRSTLVRAGVDEVAKIATDPDVVFPIMGAFGRFECIQRHPDGSQEWDLYLDVGTIHAGGRVLVEPPSDCCLDWHSIRGIQHSAHIDVAPAADGATVTMTISIQFAGRLLAGWVTGLLADGILARHIEAGLQQMRHRIEYGN
ncbi:MAG: SRPBCC family protein [Mycolicibacterium sp.]|uniref:SRPBCC family protein n=1 Tax=Mycolicibacterium sp. TaxID=2320850 RepID=UPI003D0FB17C